MRYEVNLETGEVTEHPDLPITPLSIEQARAQMPPLNRVQFVTVMRKNNLWQQANDLVANMSVEVQVMFEESQTFKRLDETLNALAGQLALSDTQVDDLFNEGYQY